jgi:hypothetical protein
MGHLLLPEEHRDNGGISYKEKHLFYFVFAISAKIMSEIDTKRSRMTSKGAWPK